MARLLESCPLVQLPAATGVATVEEVATGDAHGKLFTEQMVTVTGFVEATAPVPVKWTFLLPASLTTLLIVSDGAAVLVRLKFADVAPVAEATTE
jgi:hypothetical protein